MIQIVVHQFVRKTSTKKILKSEKNDPPLSPGRREYVESILGTFLTHGNKNIQFEYHDL